MYVLQCTCCSLLYKRVAVAVCNVMVILSTTGRYLSRDRRGMQGVDSAVGHGTLAGCPKSTGQEAPEHGIS
jgi:hypothetical protein